MLLGKLKRFLGSQQGSGQVAFSLALVAVAGGVAAYMAENSDRSLKEAQAQRTRDSSQQANASNLPALAALMRFPSGLAPNQQVATNPDYVPSVYPDPYIYSSPSEVKLVAFKAPIADARWSTDNSGGIFVEGLNNAKLNDASLDQVFQSGGSIPTGAGVQSANSRVTLLTPIVDGVHINKVRVASSAAVTGNSNGNYTNYLEAEVEVPPPPKPEVEWSGVPDVSHPLAYGQSATITFRGSGVMTDVSIVPANNSGATCKPSLPGDARSIRGRGYNLGSCTIPFQTPDVPYNDSVGYISVYVTASGPGGTTQRTVLVPAYQPPSCSFNPSSYGTDERVAVGIYMDVYGAVGNTPPQMEMPVNNTVNSLASTRAGVENWGWQHVGNWQNTGNAGGNRWGAAFSPGNEYGTADIWGRVTGPGIAPGTWRGCSNIAYVNINQTVCREHTLDEGSNYFYLGQCYQRSENSWVMWNTYGPDYNYCTGTIWYDCGWCGCDDGNPRDEGCFSPETKIQMADGSTRRIDKLHSGDLIYNPLTKRAAKLKGMVKGPETEPMIELGYDGKLVHVTTKHSMLTRTGVKAAKDLVPGEMLLGADGKYHRLEELRRLPVDPNQQVYNFVMDDSDDSPSHHVVVADGIMTGDLQLQQDLVKGAPSVQKYTAGYEPGAK